MTSRIFIDRKTLCQELGVTARHSIVADAWAVIQQAHKRGEIEGAITVAGQSVPWRNERYRNFGEAKIPMTAVGLFKAAMSARPTAGDGYLSRSALAEELGIYDKHKLLSESWSSMKKQKDAGAKSGEIEVGGVSVPWRLLYSAKNIEFPYVPASAVTTFRNVLDKSPPKAGADHLSFRRLIEELGTSFTNPVIAELKSVIEAEVNAGRMSGSVAVGERMIPWKMMQAIWGGSSKWGNVSPHLDRASLKILHEVVGNSRRAHSRDETDNSNPAPSRLSMEAFATAAAQQVAQDFEHLHEHLEDEIEVHLIGRRGEDDPRDHYIALPAIVTANGNLSFEAFGIRHVVTPEGEVFQRVRTDGRNGWIASPVLRIDPDFELSLPDPSVSTEAAALIR